MKSILSEKELYEKEIEEAYIEDDTIIPGVNGIKVDIDKSYSNMKKVGKYDRNLLVFKTIEPKIKVENNYDNYLISGNTKLNNVSIIIELYDSSFIEDLLKILNSNNINCTFFLDKRIFDENIELVKLIASFGNDIELLSTEYKEQEVAKYNSILKLITKDTLSFCYNSIKNDEVLNNCRKSSLIPVIPSIKADKYLYGVIKNDLNNGSIISIKVNKNTIDELKSSINYINQKGKRIILLKNIIK